MSVFEGRVEGLLDHKLHGWCCQVGSLVPARLELLIDGEIALEFQGDQFRDDLARAHIGNGHHGFVLDLKQLNLTDDTRLSVRVAKRTIMLDGGNQTVAALTAVLTRSVAVLS